MTSSNKKIMIVDPSEYAATIAQLLEGYKLDFFQTAYDAILALNSNRYDLVISEVTLPGDNSFELYYYIHKNLPYLPVIMITEDDIDSLFHEILQNGIGNVLNKPVQPKEFGNLVNKLLGLSPVFGLKNYINNMTEHKKIRLTNSEQINPTIRKMTNIITEWGFNIQNMMMMHLILNEIIINSLYHAHGFTKQKLKRLPVTLSEGDFVDIHFGYNSDEYALSVTDYKGTLSSQIILSSIYNVINQRRIIEEAAVTGDVSSLQLSESGRGIELVRKLAKEYYFIIEKGKRTETILMFDSTHEYEQESSAAIKIIEIE